MRLYQVEDLEVSLDRRDVVREGQVLTLRPLTFDLLVYLIEHRDRLLPKEELIGELWKGIAVSDNSLMQAISELRRALNDDPRSPRLIKTVAKTGYRFIGEVDGGNHAAEVAGKGFPARLGEPALQPAWSRPWILTAGLLSAAALVAAFRIQSGAAKQAPASLTENVEANRFYELGVQRAQQFHTQEAIDLFKRALALDPEFAMAQARIGYTYAVAWSRPEEGKPYLESAMKLPRRLREQDRLFLTAWYAESNLDYVSAVKVLRDVIAHYPEDVEAYQQLAALFIGEERFDEAARVVDAVLKVDPANAQTYNLLSNLNLSTYKFDAAVAAAQRFVALVDREPNARDTLGLALEAASDYNGAERAYRAALELQPGFQIARIHLANTLMRLGRYREAMAEYQGYVTDSSSPADQRRGWDSMATIYRLRGELKQARDTAQKNVQGETFLLLALDSGDWETIDHVLANRPTGADRGKRNSQRFLLNAYGQRELAAGNTDRAMSYFRQTLETRTPYFSLNWYEDCLADAYLKTGRADEAIAEYRRVLGRYPKMALAWYHLSQAYQAKQMSRQAQDALKTFLEIWKNADPDLPEVRDASRRLSL